MKFLNLFLCVALTFSSAFGIGSKISPLPIPQTYFLDVFDGECNSACLENLIKTQKIFTFLSKYKSETSTKYTEENYYAYSQMFNAFTGFSIIAGEKGDARIAIIVPQRVIKNYALMSVNAAISYLLRQSNNFEIAVFNSGGESEIELINAINEVKRSGFRHIIAAVTQDGVEAIFKNSNGLQVFIPTLHKSFFADAPQNIIFGGIDYSAQLEALENYSSSKTVVISDGSKLGLTLNDMVQNQDKNVVQRIVLESTKDDLRRYFQNNKNINGASVYLNTPLVMSSLLASQIRVYKREPFAILSTQINYQPSLLSFTQYEDRGKLYIANSIGKIDAELNSINSFLGNNLEYEYVNYATSIGVEFFYKHFFDSEIKPLFAEKVGTNGQVEYSTNIYKTSRYGFAQQTKMENIYGAERDLEANFETISETDEENVILGF